MGGAMIDVLVTGAAGKMGSLSAATIAAQDDLCLAALVDPRPGDGGEVPWFTDVGAALSLVSPAAALEFSVPGAVYGNTAALLDAGVPTVVGATGLADDQVADLSAKAATTGVGLVIAPNFALGAVLMMRFARAAAKYFPDCEIIELHHDGKVDFPSGTAKATAHEVASARGDAVGPARGAGTRGVEIEGVPVHSVRLPGLVAHQEVIFGGAGQTLTIRHDSLGRDSFMPGVLMAIRKSVNLDRVVLGLGPLLD